MFFPFSPFFVAVDGSRRLVKNAAWEKVQKIQNCWRSTSLVEKILSKINKIWHKLVFLLKRPIRITSNLTWRVCSCVFLFSFTVVLNCICSISLVCELWVQRCWSFSLVLWEDRIPLSLEHAEHKFPYLIHIFCEKNRGKFKKKKALVCRLKQTDSGRFRGWKLDD